MAKTKDSPPLMTATAENFITQIIEKDLSHKAVVTRFPPEPNGYLHIGHAKSICINFGLAETYRGRCHLRFDDTNPEVEKMEYVASIQEDIKWLGFDWGSHLYYASDYFDQIYQCAVELIRAGKAYVCSLSEKELKDYRGDFNRPGKNSPYRQRSIEENLDLFARMKAGEFGEGTHTLRAKIDMSSPNMNMRDPLLYRIRRVEHHRTGTKWCIYPMYDFAHPLSDAFEHISHSLCTLEFQDHRPFYDWTIEHCPVPSAPRQYEFARLNMTYLVMSKRKLLQLVNEGHVSGWDDPRLPTISGIRRRGVPPSAIRKFAARIGVSKAESPIDYEIFEACIREELDEMAQRAMAVLRPLKVLIQNIPEDHCEELLAPLHPKKPEFGHRKIFFTKTLYIESSDFMENPGPDFFRLRPGGEVRLRNAYVIRCEGVLKDSEGRVSELLCTYDPGTLGGKAPADGRKVKGIIHWVSAEENISAEVRLYKRLFVVPDPENVSEGGDFTANLNPKSMETLGEVKLEKNLVKASVEDRYQFERLGYFALDPRDSKPEKLVFNRIVELKN